MAVAFAPRPWTRQPNVAARVRSRLNPVAGLQPGGWGLVDTTGAPLTINSTMRPEDSTMGVGLRCVYSEVSLNAVSRDITAESGYPYCFVGVARFVTAAAGDACISSLATSADKTMRIFVVGGTGGCRAQHIGATTFANAITGNFWNYGTSFVVVGVFRSQTSVSCYGARLDPGTTPRGTPATTTTDVGAMAAPTIFSVGGYKGSVVASKFDGHIFMAEWLRYSPSDREVDQWLDNPWSVYEDRADYDWRGVAGVSAPTLTAASAINIGTTTATAQLSFSR